MRSRLISQAVYAQLPITDADAFLSSIFIGLVVLSLIVSFVVFYVSLQILYAALAFPATFFASYFIAQTILALLADKVASDVERVLPDMLLLMAANLRAGMIPSNSFLASIKPQFGRLNPLLNYAAIEIQSGKDFSQALVEMGDRTNSRFFKDTMRIISESLRSGAELHRVLEHLAENMLQNEELRERMRAQVRSYAMFIFIASTIAAPLLYGVSSLLIGILDSIGNISSGTSSVPVGTGLAGGLFSSFALPNVPISLVVGIAVINVIVTTGASALLSGVLNSGSAKEGLKYIPLYVAIGLAIFFVARIGASSFFSSSLLSSGGASSPPAV